MKQPVSVRQFASAAFLVMLAASPFAAGRPQSAVQPPPKFRSGIEVIAVEVTVVDRAGKPVEGLKPDDFAVTVDGLPRRVASAQFISYHAPAPVTQPPETPTDSTPAPIPTPVLRGRDVVIVLDEDSLETADALLAKRAAGRLLDQLGPADRVGIATVPRLRSNFSMTPDRAENRRVLASWVPGVTREPPGPYWIGVAEAFEIERNDPTTIQKVTARECGSGQAGSRGRSGTSSSQCGRELIQEAKQLAVRLHARGTGVLQALRLLGLGLRQIDGPKTVVLVSGGLMTPESMSAFSDIEADFAASQITLYTLFFEKSSYNVARAPSPTLGDDDRIEGEGLENVTAAAGGVMIRVIGTAESHFDRVASELSASYLLGIEVTAADRDGKQHRVEVKIARPGVEVRGQKQYVIPVSRRPLP